MGKVESTLGKNVATEEKKLGSGITITMDEVKLAALRFEKQGPKYVGIRKGIAGLSILRNAYHITSKRAEAIVRAVGIKRGTY